MNSQKNTKILVSQHWTNLLPLFKMMALNNNYYYYYLKLRSLQRSVGIINHVTNKLRAESRLPKKDIRTDNTSVEVGTVALANTFDIQLTLT